MKAIVYALNTGYLFNDRRTKTIAIEPKGTRRSSYRETNRVAHERFNDMRFSHAKIACSTLGVALVLIAYPVWAAPPVAPIAISVIDDAGEVFNPKLAARLNKLTSKIKSLLITKLTQEGLIVNTGGVTCDGKNQPCLNVAIRYRNYGNKNESNGSYSEYISARATFKLMESASQVTLINKGSATDCSLRNDQAAPCILDNVLACSNTSGDPCKWENIVTLVRGLKNSLDMSVSGGSKNEIIYAQNIQCDKRIVTTNTLLGPVRHLECVVANLGPQATKSSSSVEGLIFERPFNNLFTPVTIDGKNVDSKYRSLIDAVGELVLGCTVSHVGNGIVITAGHCVLGTEDPQPKYDLPCEDRKYDIFWQYRGGNPQIYESSKCHRILAAELNSSKDYAIIEITGNPPVSMEVDLTKKAVQDQQITLFGHPQRRPLEWSKFCKVVDLQTSKGSPPSAKFLHKCDTEPGNSGSAIIDGNTLKVVGIHNGADLFPFTKADHSIVKEPWNYATHVTETTLGVFLVPNVREDYRAMALLDEGDRAKVSVKVLTRQANARATKYLQTFAMLYKPPLLDSALTFAEWAYRKDNTYADAYCNAASVLLKKDPKDPGAKAANLIKEARKYCPASEIEACARPLGL